jgi:hypothetical protein
VQFRVFLAASTALACAACANDRTPQVLGFQAHAAATKPTADAARDELPPLKKTMASKVLAAIALERVTGRKPDPARLADLN